MKDNNNAEWVQKKTDPLLLKAQLILSAYSKSTGAQVCVMDRNYLSIPEIFDQVNTERNTCLYCMKHKLNLGVCKNKDFLFHPCREMHIDAMKNALLSGGSYVYNCELGFNFWTSPIYSNRGFAGALIGGGFLCNDVQETVEKMLHMGDGSESKEDLLKRLSPFPQVDSRHIESLAELLLICAEFLSRSSGDYYETIKRKFLQQKEISVKLEKMKEKYPPGSSPPPYPLEMEKTLLEAVRRGRITEAINIHNELFGYLLYFYANEFETIRFRTIELAVLLSRMENSSNGFFGMTQQFLKTLEEAETTDELMDSLYLMIRHLAEQASSFQGIRHYSALKRAEQYILRNFSRKLSLKEIAAASGLSAPYFSTVFRNEMGENLSVYLNRLRVEKASRLLIETNLPLGEISSLCGFEDQSWFSKIFKSFCGINPGKYRLNKKRPVPAVPESEMSDNYKTLAGVS